MISGPSSRNFKTQKAYEQAPVDGDGCPFCAFISGQTQVLRELDAFWIVTNLYPYDNWDGLNVEAHLMIVPKRHVDSLSHLRAKELKQYAEIVADYEAKGYSIYARAANNISKSVSHQHTHLIKLGTKKHRFMLHLRKPMIRIKL